MHLISSSVYLSNVKLNMHKYTNIVPKANNSHYYQTKQINQQQISWVINTLAPDFIKTCIMRKPAFCISENKAADQLCGNRAFLSINRYCIPKINQRTNGTVNAHLISWPSKAQNIQNLENIW